MQINDRSREVYLNFYSTKSVILLPASRKCSQQNDKGAPTSQSTQTTHSLIAFDAIDVFWAQRLRAFWLLTGRAEHPSLKEGNF